MDKYTILNNLLDKIITDSGVEVHNLTDEQICSYRARAYIHLYLQVSFGLTNYSEREYYVTDGTNDGGIDAYYVSKTTKTIYLIQSKYRANKKNFENKEITIAEILKMDIDRILDGEKEDESGNKYNGKILQLIREISELPDISRYRYQVIIIANLQKLKSSEIKKIIPGYSVEIFDYEKTYTELLFPLISATYFTAEDVHIQLNLSDKNSASKITYNVTTDRGDCDITVVFVPIIEIGRIMSLYKNSLLKYNPRSYLEMEGKNTNLAIRESIVNKSTNEFALYNNGITIISDETTLSEKTGKKDRAQLTITNPQIINGGQTSFTISRIYEETAESDRGEIFGNKEVLVKIITMHDADTKSQGKASLIEDISISTNKQTTVTNADRLSNEISQIELQELLFDKYGIFYERKSGEFSSGINLGLIQSSNILNRNIFPKIFNCGNGFINKVFEKKQFIKVARNNFLREDYMLDRFFAAYLLLKKLVQNGKSLSYLGMVNYIQTYLVICFLEQENRIKDIEFISSLSSEIIIQYWRGFYDFARKSPNKLVRDKKNPDNEPISRFLEKRWYLSQEIIEDMLVYIQSNTIN